MNKILKQAIGIDMSKDKFDVCFSLIDSQQKVSIKSTRKFGNTKAGFKEFDSWIEKHAQKQVPLVYVVEATGIYYENLAWHLFEHGAHLSVILPNKAKKYFESLGLKSKNDKIDAKGLSRMCAEQSLEKWQPISSDFYKIRTLTREIEGIHQVKTALNNQLHALKHARILGKSSIKRLEQHITLLDKQLLSIEKEIEKIVSQNPEIKAKVDKIIKIKGLGLVSTITVLAECDGFALIKNQKQLVSYAGYDVVENQSGKRTGKTRISKKGNSHIRRILHMPAFNVVRYDQRPFKSFHDRLLESGKTKMQAYVAVQKKLLVLIYTLWKKDEEYVGNETKGTSGIDEPKPLFSLGSAGDTKKIAPEKTEATQDGLPYNESPEALFSLEQIY